MLLFFNLFLDLIGAIIMMALIYCHVPVTGLNILPMLSVIILTKMLGRDLYNRGNRIREVN